MSGLEGGAHPVLVYNRIAHNKHNTWMLVAASVLALLPFVGSLSYLFASGVVWRVRSESRNEHAIVRSYERTLRRSAKEGVRTEWDQWLERDSGEAQGETGGAGGR